MVTSILRHMHITDWALRSPDRLPYALTPEKNTVTPRCWVVGELPLWMEDLCQVLQLTEYRQVALSDELPESVAAHDWILWCDASPAPSYASHPRQLVFNASSVDAKQQLWHQLCQHEY